MAEEEISNEDLADMIQVNIVEKMATKDDVEEIIERLDRIEKIILSDHQWRIQQLEDLFCFSEIRFRRESSYPVLVSECSTTSISYTWF